MAIEGTTETIQLKSVTRTRQFDVVTALGADPVITAHRESLKMNGDDVFSRDNAPSTTRKFSQVVGESVVIPGGQTVTLVQIAQALPIFFDRWALEDETSEDVVAE